MSVDIVFETHSWSEDNERGIATGWLPGLLSERGRTAAAELGKRHHEAAIAAIFTSDLARAVETAAIAFGVTGIPIIQDERLRECNYGRLNGMPVERLQAERAQHVDEPFPGGESYQQVVVRVAAFLTDLLRGYDGRRVVLIGHSATRWALEHVLRGVPLEHLVAAPFEWQPGWEYTLPAGWQPRGQPGL